MCFCFWLWCCVEKFKTSKISSICPHGFLLKFQTVFAPSLFLSLSLTLSPCVALAHTVCALINIEMIQMGDNIYMHTLHDLLTLMHAIVDFPITYSFSCFFFFLHSSEIWSSSQESLEYKNRAKTLKDGYTQQQRKKKYNNETKIVTWKHVVLL